MRTKHQPAHADADETWTSSPRKRALLRVALRQFRERGYAGATMNEIGAAAGVTGPALYHHFRSKDDLLVAALVEVGREIDAASRAVIGRRDLEPREALQELIAAFVEVVLREPDMIAVYLLEARYLPADTYASLRGAEERHRDRWAHFLRLARPELTETRAKTMVRLAIFMIGRACLEDPELDARQLAKLLIDMTMTALLETS
jgi:AcrR family transcriptional regulator